MNTETAEATLPSADSAVLNALLQIKSRWPEAPHCGLNRQGLLAAPLQQAQMLWLNAPAGYGKSVLLADYARSQQQQGVPVLWCRIDSQDQPAAQFLLHLLELAARHWPAIEQTALAHWYETGRRGHVDTEQVLLLWLEALQQGADPLLLCLDDVHNLSDDSSWQLLVRLLELLPERVSVVLASRHLPGPLGRLHLLPRLHWLPAAILVFSDDDTQRLLQQHGIARAAELVMPLSRRLQGWPAGLAIWLACYRAAGQPAEPPASLGAAEAGDYLQGEVLQQQSEALQNFIGLVAVLGTFNETLLRHCCGNDQYHQLLQQALQQNLFITPLTTVPGWFQVHPLMAGLLAVRLPESQRLQLHRQAFSWLSQHRQPVAALQHALAAGMGEEVQEWVGREAEQILANLDIAGLLHWFEQLGPELLQQSPRLMAIACWALLLTQQREQARSLLQSLLQRDYVQAFEADALQGYLARLDGDLDGSALLCRRALEALPPARFALRILMSSTLAHLQLARQDTEDARHWNRLTQDLARQYQAPALEALSLFDYARIELNRGHISRSSAIIERGLQLLDGTSEHADRLPRARLLLYRAVLLWLTGGSDARLEDALRQGIAVSTELRDVSVCYGYGVEAMRCAARQDFTAALGALDAAERLMQRWQVERSTYEWLALVKVNIWITQGKLVRAQQGLDQLLRGRTFLALPRPELFPMQPGFALLTQARLWLHNGQVNECLGLLEQALRQRNNPLLSLVLGLLRSAALRLQQPGGDAQQVFSQALRSLQREGLALSLPDWLPGLSDGSVSLDSGRGLALSANLSERELEVLRKIAQGLSNQDIADQLFISLHTVKTHARKINVKLGARSRTQALHRAQELNLL